MDSKSYLNNILLENEFQIDLEEFNYIYKSNKKKDEEKQLLIRKRNAESAKKGRIRKKIVFENLIKENKLLKEKITILENELKKNICNECKKKINQNNTFQIVSNQTKNFPKKTIFFFTTISIIFLIFTIKFKTNFKIRELFLRELNYLTSENYYSSTLDYILNSTIKLKNLYIRYGDYYSIIYKKTFLNDKYLNFVKLEKTRFFHEDNLTEEMIPEEHIFDYIQLKENAIKDIGPLKFSLFLNPAFIKTDSNRTYMNKTFEGNEMKFLFYELKLIGYSRNQGCLK